MSNLEKLLKNKFVIEQRIRSLRQADLVESKQLAAKKLISRLQVQLESIDRELNSLMNEDDGRLNPITYTQEPDHEVQMARSQLYRTAKKAIMLHKVLQQLPEENGLEGWVQAKITKASDYLDSVWAYLSYEMRFPEDQQEESLEEDDRPVDNFTIDDIKRLERMRDFNQMKDYAKKLISTPSQKPLQPAKVAWLSKTIDSKRSPMDLIKLMYDLMLGGEGNKVIGSRFSMQPNIYRKTFGENDVAEAVAAYGPGEDPNTPQTTPAAKPGQTSPTPPAGGATPTATGTGMVKMSKLDPNKKPIGTPIMVKNTDIPSKQKQGFFVIGESASAGASSAGGIAASPTGFANGGIGMQKRKKKVGEFFDDSSPERDDGGKPKFMPWEDFIRTIASLTSSNFDLVQKKSKHKDQISVKFVPHDSYAYGPTMIYAFRDRRPPHPIGVRAQFQTGTYNKLQDRVITQFKLPTDSKLRSLDMTPANARIIADIIMGNREGALKESVEEADISRRDLMKGGAAAGAAAAVGGAGYGLYKMDQINQEKERVLLSQVTDPEDIAKYKKLKSRYANAIAMGGADSKNLTYQAIANAASAELEVFKKQLRQKYNIVESSADDNEETYKVRVKTATGERVIRVQATNDQEAEEKAMEYSRKKNYNPVSAKSEGIYYREGADPKFTGYWKGTDKGRPGKKMVGGE